MFQIHLCSLFRSAASPLRSSPKKWNQNPFLLSQPLLKLANRLSLIVFSMHAFVFFVQIWRQICPPLHTRSTIAHLTSVPVTPSLAQICLFPSIAPTAPLFSFLSVREAPTQICLPPRSSAHRRFFSSQIRCHYLYHETHQRQSPPFMHRSYPFTHLHSHLIWARSTNESPQMCISALPTFETTARRWTTSSFHLFVYLPPILIHETILPLQLFSAANLTGEDVSVWFTDVSVWFVHHLQCLVSSPSCLLSIYEGRHHETQLLRFLLLIHCCYNPSSLLQSPRVADLYQSSLTDKRTKPPLF